LTASHIFPFPTALFTYKSGTYDPEGILGTLTSVFQVWLGVQAGIVLQVYQNHFSRLWRWTAWAVITGCIGAALCGAKQTGGLIPVNKNLWWVFVFLKNFLKHSFLIAVSIIHLFCRSLSYVMVTTSFALILLIALYVMIDLKPKKIWSGTPFFEPGMNSILLYVCHSMGNVMLPFHFNYKNEMNKTHFTSLIESLWGISLWVLIAVFLHRRKFFWSV
jgi:heparan-alpha-glucosaminide N-acetyltransferase